MWSMRETLLKADFLMQKPKSTEKPSQNLRKWRPFNGPYLMKAKIKKL